MRIEVDLELCQGHAVCQDEAPSAFTVPKRGKVEILKPTPDAADRAEVERAVRYCPTQALTLIAEADSTTKGAR